MIPFEFRSLEGGFFVESSGSQKSFMFFLT